MSDELLERIRMLEEKLGRPSSNLKYPEKPVIEEMTKPNGSTINVNIGHKPNLDLAKSLGWKRKPGPKADKPETDQQ